MTKAPAFCCRWNWQHGPAGGFQADMIVRDDQPYAHQAAREQTLQEAPPVDLGLRGGDLAAQHAALAASLDADSDQDRAIDDAAFQTHLEVDRIQKQIGYLSQGALRAYAPRQAILPPSGQNGIYRKNDTQLASWFKM